MNSSHSPELPNLLRKLLTTYHLNVPERQSLPDGRVAASQLCGVISGDLNFHKRFPVNRHSSDLFTGGLIEQSDQGKWRVTWRAEISIAKIGEVVHEEFDSVNTAAQAYVIALHKEFKSDIDGVPIDWDV